jgi:hypothetical protein
MIEFLKKIQEKSEPTRKVIFWFIMVFLAALFFGLWILSFQHKLISINRDRLGQEMNLPAIEEGFKNMPLPSFPKLDGKQLEELEKLLSQPSAPPQTDEEKN